MSGKCPRYYNVDMLLRTLGGLELASSSFARPKPLLLLCYLALEGPKERRYLAELFWPVATDPLNRLAVTLARLRKAAPGVIGVDHTRAWADLVTDAQELLAAVEGGRFEEALSLYCGTFLESVYFEAWGSELEEWVYGTRDFLAGQVKTAHLLLGEAETGEGRFRDAAKRAEAALSVARTAGLEPSDIARLHTLLLAGDSPHAVTLEKEAATFGVKLLKTPAEAKDALRRVAGNRRVVPSNLPSRSTSFVGRDRELAELAAALADEGARLITVLGPAGIGKTSLALEAARQQCKRGNFRDGVYVAPLDALSSAAAIPNKLAEVLGVPLERAAPLQLQRHLAGKDMLVVLDNYEHLLDGVSFAAELLRACPNLKLLVTSRERLNLQGEWLFTLEGLSFADETAELEHVLAHDAVRLFTQRAKQAQPTFSLTLENVPAVREICRLVEGLPLGLELAASWVRVMPCAEIAEEISNNLDFLTVGTRDLPERHRSLRAAFEHSWRLLTPTEQEVLGKLSVFRGGFTREASAEVVGATIPLLRSLVDKSLLRVSERGRYDRHPLLYSYTQEKLLEHPEAKVEAEEKHAAYFSDLAEHLAFETEGTQPGRAFTRLEVELENVRAAWRWAVTHKSTRTLDACSKALGQYLFNRGQSEEAITLWTSALAVLDEDDVSHHATLANLMASLSYEYEGLGRLDEVEKLAERGLTLLRPHRGGREGIFGMFNCLLTLAAVAQRRGHFRRAIAFLHQQEALGLFRASGGHLSQGRHLNNLSLLETGAGNYAAAQAYLQRALEHNRRDNKPRGVVTSLVLLGDAHFHAGEAEMARRYYREAAALVRHEGLGWGNDDFALEHLGKVALALGDFEEAQNVACELLEKHPLPDEFHRFALELLGRAETAQGRFGQAAAYLKKVVRMYLDRVDGVSLGQLGSLQDVILAFAELWVNEKRYGQAAAVLAFLLRHLHEAYARAWAERLLVDVQPMLSAEEFKAATLQSHELSLEGVVQGFLASD